MSNISDLLLDPSSSSLGGVMSLTLPFLVLMVSAFVVYLLRCYVEEWRIRRRIQRRLARARARAATTSMPALNACERPASDCAELTMAEAA